MNPMVLSLAFAMLANSQGTTPAFAHVQNSFSLTVDAPYAEAAPLFGPNGERGWSEGHWDPQFFYPQPGRDIEGAVFSVQHGSMKSVWVNTLFDMAAPHFQYVSFIPNALVTVIDVRFEPIGETSTKVNVTYTRTALDPTANEHVKALGESDKTSGKSWEEAVNAYIHSHKH